jgi:hypothetical protein
VTGAPFVVGYRPAAVVRAGVPAVLLPLGAAYAAWTAQRTGPWLSAVLWVVFGFVTCVFVPLFVRAAVRWLGGAPLLTVDGGGVTLHSARVRLPWSNVAEVRIRHRPGQAGVLVFVPADAARATGGLRGPARWFARSGIDRLGGPVFLRTDQLTCPVDDLLAAVRAVAAVPVRHRPAPVRLTTGP